MNKIHNIIWSKSKKSFIVVAEGTSNCTKSGMRGLKVMIALILLSPGIGMSATLPQGGVISVGQGTIVNINNTLTIKQTTDKLGVNWQSFNVGADGQVVFEQPNSKSVAMNRVIGSDGSAILGRIDANGQVFVINPNGVIFGKDAQVNVGGLVASTLNLTDENFSKGDYSFTAEGGKNGEVLNQGTIQAAEGGYVALIGKSVKNQGVIKAQLGTASLAAGNAVTLDFSGDGLLNIQVKESAVNALAENKGLIKADGGSVLMTARSSNALIQTVVNNEGVIEAQTLETRGGKIFLDAGQDDGAVHVAGTLDASAPVSGNGGFIETSGKTVKIDDGAIITTKSKQGKSGTWLVDPTDFTISAGSGSQTSSGIGAGTLVTALGSGNVTLQTAAGGTEKGDIYVNADVAWSSDNTLTLTAANSIYVNANIDILGNSNGGLVMNFATPNYFIAKGSAITLSSSGTPTYTENGHDFFLMKSLTDLLQLNNAAKSGGYFALANSLDASATSGWNGGLGYDPALMGSSFQGTINGLGNSISNLSINRPNQDYVGLIGQSTNATISNLSVAGTVAGNNSVGLIAGKAAGGVLYNVDSNGSVTGTGNFIGGLVGELNGGTLTDSYSISTVSGVSNVGGVIGRSIGSSSISNVYSTGNVLGTGFYTGGLVGYMSGGTLSNSNYQSTVTGTSYVGGVVGWISSSGNISSVYSTGIVSGTGGNIGGLVGDLYGSTLTNSHSNSTVSGASYVGGVVGWGTNNSDISNVYSTGNVTGTVSYTGGLVGWVDGGTLTNSNFQGTVSGVSNVGGIVGLGNANASISDVYSTGYVTGTGNYTGGLVGQYNGSSLIDSYSTSTVSGTSFVGGIIGWSTGNANISTVHSTGNVSGGSNVGGIAGLSNVNTSISDVYSTGNVTGTGLNTGGLVGQLSSATLTNGYSLGSVTGVENIGGILGLGNASANISDVYSAGSVTGTGNYTGGLVGQYNGSTLTNSYSLGAVFGTSYVGGVVGWGSNSVNISTVHSNGNVSGTSNIGGIVGMGNASANITDVYSTGNVTGTGNYTGGIVGQFNGSTLTNSYSLGTISGTSYVGGIVGWGTANSIISTVHSTGNVSGSASVGGIVGLANVNASISDVYAAGNVTGTGLNTGGLVGQLSAATLTNSHSLGSVSGSGHTGGIVGYASANSSISNVYSNGNVTGTSNYTGGLVGQLNGSTLINSYSLGTVSGTSYVGGLIGWGTANASISNVYSTGNVTGTDTYTGGLVGYLNGGTLTNSNYQGTVSGTSNVGGIVGWGTGANISNVYSTGNVTGTSSSTGGLVGLLSGGSLNNSYSVAAVYGIGNVGGLVGYGTSGANISNVYSSSNVTSTTNNAGGLAGRLDGSTLTNGYAIGNIYGSTAAGGIVGYANLNSNISTVYFTGSVTGTASLTGGLVGEFRGSTLSNGYSIGSVYGITHVGGVVGRAISNANISTVFSTGNVAGTGNYVGGLAGTVDTSTLTNAYATGTVSGTSAVGGLVGLVNNAQISNVYSTGLVITPGIAGGLIASGTGTNTITEAYWDTTLSGQASSDFGIGYANLTDPLIFSTWDIAHAGGSSNIWRMYDGLTGPLLRVFMGTATAAPGSASTITYNGQNQHAGDFPVPTLTTDTTPGFFQPHANQNTWSFTQNGAAIRNAGSYVVDGWYSTQFGYDITDPVKSTLLINKAALAVTATGVNRVYDGTATGSLAFADNRFAGDELTLSSTATFSDKNVGTGKVITVTGITASGADAQNYDWNTTAASTTADITKANLNISAVGQDKVYDGTTAANASLSDNRITGDDLTISADPASFADKNAGEAKSINISGISVTGADVQNYEWNTTTSTTADIAKASLNITASGVNKTYDGTTTADVTFSDDRIGYDVLIFGSASKDFADKNAGIGKTVSVNGINVAGIDADNYTWNTTTATTADIAKADLVVKAQNGGKVEGEADGALNWTLQSGSLFGTDSLNGLLARDAGEEVGQYNINNGSLDAGTNYNLSFVAGKYDISAAGTPPVDVDPVDPPVVIEPAPPAVDVPTPPIVPVKNVQLERAKEIISTLSSATNVFSLTDKAMKEGAKQTADIIRGDLLTNYGMKLPEDTLQANESE